MTITESLRYVAEMLEAMPGVVAICVEPGPWPRVQLSDSGAWRPYIPTGETVMVDVTPQALHVRWRRGRAACVVVIDPREVRTLDGLDMVDACGRRLVVGEAASLIVCDQGAE